MIKERLFHLDINLPYRNVDNFKKIQKIAQDREVPFCKIVTKALEDYFKLPLL